MTLYLKRALQDIRDNRFLNVVTVITIALSILIVSSFTLFLGNAAEIANTWKKGIRLMAYLKPDYDAGKAAETRREIKSLAGIADAVFISKDKALNMLKSQMRHQGALFENLKENPLPDAFEVQLTSEYAGEEIELLAKRIEALPAVDEVEYGQSWLGKFNSLLNLFRLAGYAVGTLFFMAAVFITANTIRLVLYSRRQEIEIMRLVGAADGFIKMPFYLEGLILGALGGGIGLGILFLIYLLISANVQESLIAGLFQIRFIGLRAALWILSASMFAGWLGCYLSLKQFLKA